MTQAELKKNMECDQYYRKQMNLKLLQGSYEDDLEKVDFTTDRGNFFKPLLRIPKETIKNKGKTRYPYIKMTAIIQGKKESTRTKFYKVKEFVGNKMRIKPVMSSHKVAEELFGKRFRYIYRGRFAGINKSEYGWGPSVRIDKMFIISMDDDDKQFGEMEIEEVGEDEEQEDSKTKTVHPKNFKSGEDKGYEKELNVENV